jgi:hypothetical protein
VYGVECGLFEDAAHVFVSVLFGGCVQVQVLRSGSDYDDHWQPDNDIAFRADQHVDIFNKYVLDVDNHQQHVHHDDHAGTDDDHVQSAATTDHYDGGPDHDVDDQWSGNFQHIHVHVDLVHDVNQYLDDVVHNHIHDDEYDLDNHDHARSDDHDVQSTAATHHDDSRSDHDVHNERSRYDEHDDVDNHNIHFNDHDDEGTNDLFIVLDIHDFDVDQQHDHIDQHDIDIQYDHHHYEGADDILHVLEQFDVIDIDQHIDRHTIHIHHMDAGSSVVFTPGLRQLCD